MPAIVTAPKEFIDDWMTDVREREEHALNPRGHAYLENLHKFIHVHARLREDEADAAALAHEAAHDERRRDALRNDRRYGNARHVEMQIDDEEEVEHDVDDARDRKIEERAARVADGAQHGAAEVVNHHRRHAKKYMTR